MKFWQKYRLFCLFFLAGLIVSCANQGELSGGEKDNDAPVIVESFPKNNSTNFAEKSIQLTFNEFVKLNNINQQLLISPPLEEKPEFKLRGKNIIIQFKDSLKPNTTYSMFFGDAIVDITEANPISGFNYVFSTGNEIDSLRIKGQIKDAFTLEPAADVFVMLYRNHSDTAPMRSLPDYITKTRKDGVFTLNNLSSGNYKIFALQDANNNYKFDQPTEGIAFLDSLIIPHISSETKLDTLYQSNPDTTIKEKIIDTIINREYNKFLPDNLYLKLFTEDHKKQSISKKTRTLKHYAEVIFSKPNYGHLVFYGLNFKLDSNQYLVEKSKLSDSLTFWFTDSLLIKKDSLGLIFEYEQKDSLENISIEKDTTFLVYKKPADKKKKDEIEAKPVIKVEIKLQQGVQHFGKPLIIEASSPVMSVNLDKIRLLVEEDTTKKACVFSLEKDPENPRKFSINYKWEENARYFIYFDSLAFIDYYSIPCDSSEFTFNTKTTEDYGTLILNVRGIKESVIIQMLDKTKKNVIREFYLEKNKKMKFVQMQAQELNFRAIIDENKNKRYDTGRFIFKRQAENVIYFSKTVIIKNNWEIEEDWNIEE